jgi:hypothetical protein
MAYDQENGVVVLFGGYGNGSHLSDTWALDVGTKTWKNMEPSHAPSPRAATTMVYDRVNEQMILFGGFGLGHSVVSNETWTYSYERNEWSRIETEFAPSERASYGMALDTQRQELVLFGGFTEMGYFNDLWVYNIVKQEWQILEVSGESPAPRGAMSFVYDVKKDYFVMFGGFSDQGFFSDTWILDPNAAAWIEVKPESSPPSLRSRMVYDDSSGISVLFGGDTIPLEGHQGSAVPYGKTWSYNSSEQRWTEISAHNSPKSRALNGIAYVTDTDTVVIFGGTDTLIDDANFVGHEFQDTWVLAPEKGRDDFGIILVLPIIVVAGALGIFVIARRKKRKTTAE